jgi:uncharacterized cupin superfamily protein
MVRSFSAGDVPVSHAPLESADVVHGDVTTGEVELDTIGEISVGVWEHSMGTSTATEIDEVFVVISGRGRVTDVEGNVIELAPGVIGVLPAGASTTWEVTEPIRKVWITLAD